jgi:hypothetical protein
MGVRNMDLKMKCGLSSLRMWFNVFNVFKFIFIIREVREQMLYFTAIHLVCSMKPVKK